MRITMELFQPSLLLIAPRRQDAGPRAPSPVQRSLGPPTPEGTYLFRLLPFQLDWDAGGHWVLESQFYPLVRPGAPEQGRWLDRGPPFSSQAGCWCLGAQWGALATPPKPFHFLSRHTGQPPSLPPKPIENINSSTWRLSQAGWGWGCLWPSPCFKSRSDASCFYL